MKILPFGVLEIAKWFTTCMQMAAVTDVGQGPKKKQHVLESHQQPDGEGLAGAEQMHLFSFSILMKLFIKLASLTMNVNHSSGAFTRHI